jgi:uncharacterized protein (DUF3820 family)
MTDNDLMPFGKFKEEKMANVPPEHLLWFFEHTGTVILMFGVMFVIIWM